MVGLSCSWIMAYFTSPVFSMEISFPFPSTITLQYLLVFSYSSNGYLNVRSSHSTTPKEYTSDDKWYSPVSSLITSGANHCHVLSVPAIPDVIDLANPKSATFALTGASSSIVNICFYYIISFSSPILTILALFLLPTLYGSGN